jgi:hypothetical protein
LKKVDNALMLVDEPPHNHSILRIERHDVKRKKGEGSGVEGPFGLEGHVF